MLTDQELQTLRNLGGLSEDAAIEIETLRAANFSLAAGACIVQGGGSGEITTVPVVYGFDNRRVVGELRIRTDTLPPTRDFVLSPAVQQYPDRYVLKYISVSLVPAVPVQDEMRPDHRALLKRQRAAEYRSWQSPFIVRAASMFNVPVSEVTLAMYVAAVERTQQDTVPPGGGG